MKLTSPNSRRMPELDALRGLFLVWMTFTHMPTRFSDFVNQPFGFVSSAEGFVFMSALLVSRVYLRESQELRLMRLYPKTLVKAATDTMLVPQRMASIAGPYTRTRSI